MSHRCTLPFPSICANLKGEGGGFRNTPPPPPTDPLWIFILKLMHVNENKPWDPTRTKKKTRSLVPCGKIIWEGGGVQIFLPQG